MLIIFCSFDTDVQQVKARFSTLYVPSDFFHAKIKWPEVFTLENPFSLHRHSQFHIMHRVVESPVEVSPEELDPPDASYLYSAKVMLLACPPIVELYAKCFDEEDGDDSHAMRP